MSDNFHLRDAAGNVTAILQLSCYDAGRVNLTIYSADDGVVDLLRDTHLSAAAARLLAAELLACANACEGGQQ